MIHGGYFFNLLFLPPSVILACVRAEVKEGEEQTAGRGPFVVGAVSGVEGRGRTRTCVTPNPARRRRFAKFTAVASVSEWAAVTGQNTGLGSVWGFYFSRRPVVPRPAAEELAGRSARTSRAAGARAAPPPGCTARGPPGAPRTPGWRRTCGQRAETAGNAAGPAAPRKRRRRRHRPAVGPVQVREEQHPAAQEGEQQEHAVELVQQSVLLPVLGAAAGGGA